jgi:hypothetical protein
MKQTETLMCGNVPMAIRSCDDGIIELFSPAENRSDEVIFWIAPDGSINTRSHIIRNLFANIEYIELSSNP